MKPTIITDEYIKQKIKKRASDTHKGDYGKLMLFVTSIGMPGAGVLCAKAALRSGAGLVRLAVPQGNYSVVASRIPEPVYTLLPQNECGTACISSLDILSDIQKQSDAQLIGCGLGRHEDIEKLVDFLLKNTKIPTVLDADGINAILKNILVLKEVNAPLIITPHEAEMARLINKTPKEVHENRLEIATDFSKKYNATVVLKGKNTLISQPNGQVFMCEKGNAGMATGGSGDVLSGIIVSLLGQGLSAADSAVCGAYIHAYAGDLASCTLSEYAMLPTDIINFLPNAFLSIVSS